MLENFRLTIGRVDFVGLSVGAPRDLHHDMFEGFDSSLIFDIWEPRA